MLRIHALVTQVPVMKYWERAVLRFATLTPNFVM